jgi:hypothetical protein
LKQLLSKPNPVPKGTTTKESCALFDAEECAGGDEGEVLRCFVVSPSGAKDLRNLCKIIRAKPLVPKGTATKTNQSFQI